MVSSRARESTEALRWLRRRLATERLLDALREKAPDPVIELPPRPSKAQTRVPVTAPRRAGGAC